MLVRTLPLLLWVGFAASVAWPDAPAPDPVAASVQPFFRAFEVDVAALSPDGRYLAMGVADDKKTAIALVDLGDVSRRDFVLTDSPAGENPVVQILWQSPERLVFTLRNRTVGLVDVNTGEVKSLLDSNDMRFYQPTPQLGPRRNNVMVTPDMPADPTTSPMGLGSRREVSIEEALVETLVSGDMFDTGAHRISARALSPHLLGLRDDGQSASVLLELRTDRDPLDDATVQRQRIVVPSNTIVTSSLSAPPSGAEFEGAGPGAGYASYDVVYPPTPCVLLELEPKRWRQKVVLQEDSWIRVIPDRQGRPRLALALQGNRRRYMYSGVEKRKWVPLESIVREEITAGFTVTPETLLEPRVIPLGFDPDGVRLYVASNIGSDTFGLRALDTSTGRFTELSVIHGQIDLVEPTEFFRDDAIVIDPHQDRLVGVRYSATVRDTVWLDAELGLLQRNLNAKLAPLRCEILEWDAARKRFLIDVFGPGEPGGYHVYDGERGRLIECSQRAPWLTAESLNEVQAFEFNTADGRRLAGCVTLPRRPRLNPAPVLVYFHDGPWFCTTPAFDRGAQALAALGFAVVQVNHRGSSGSGRNHLNAIKDELDRAVLADVKAVLARASEHLPVNPHMAAALGNGFGGYLAVRAVQLAPETFRCAVAINTPGDLESWCVGSGSSGGFQGGVRRSFLGTDRGVLKAGSALAVAAETTRPVLVVHGTENAYVPEWMGKRLFGALRKSSAQPSFLALEGEGHSGWSRRTTASLFAELGRFFNATIYSYSVEIGPSSVDP